MVMLRTSVTDDLDERPASWKVLLPTKPGGRVLAIGVNAGTACALSRTWATVDRADCTDDLRNPALPYDIVVCRDGRIDLERIYTGVRPDGAIVIENGSACVCALRRAGWSYVKRYAKLPGAKPRVMFSVESRRKRELGLTFHQPSTRKSIWLMRLARWLSRLGVKRHLMRSTVVVAMRERGGGLCARLSDRLGREVVDLLIYTGSNAPHRKMTVLPVFASGPCDVVVRLADTRAGAAAVIRDAEAIGALAATSLAEHAPSPLFCEQWGGYTVSAETAIPMQDGPAESQFSEDHLWFLGQLSRLDRRSMPLAATRPWQVIARVSEEAMPPAAATLRRRLRRDASGVLITCHRSHGDFAPWNVRTTCRGLAVVDWEDSDVGAPAFTDLFHFHIRQAAYVGPWHGGAAILKALRDAAVRLCRLEGFDIREIEPALCLWLLHEYVINGEMRDCLTEMLEALAAEGDAGLSDCESDHAAIAS